MSHYSERHSATTAVQPESTLDEMLTPQWCGQCDGGILNGQFCTCELGVYAKDTSVDPDSQDYDDDPRCVCGVYRSEHSLCGCPEGFQTPKQWESEKEFISTLDDDQFEQIYHPEYAY